MSCSSIDLKAYFLGELPPAERAPVEKHLNACAACREELERLDSMRTALAALADEEPPQRIAFVSDKVFEPRWWQTVWHSGPVMGFASALLLAVAIFVHAYARPAAQPAVAQADSQRIQQEVDAAVAKAVAAVEAKQDERILKAVSAAEQRFDQQYQRDLANAGQAVAYYQEKMARMMVASNNASRSGQ